MDPAGVAAVVTVGVLILPLMALTGFGARRRGQRGALAVASGVFFPVTWTVWYVRDERRRSP